MTLTQLLDCETAEAGHYTEEAVCVDEGWGWGVEAGEAGSAVVRAKHPRDFDWQTHLGCKCKSAGKGLTPASPGCDRVRPVFQL